MTAPGNQKPISSSSATLSVTEGEKLFWEACQDDHLPHYWHIKTRFTLFRLWAPEEEAKDLAALHNNEIRALSVTEAHPKEETGLGIKEAASDSHPTRQNEVGGKSRRHMRGECTVCGQRCALTNEGMIWRHIVSSKQCAGGGHPPVSSAHPKEERAPYVSSETGQERELNAIRRAAGYPSEHPKGGQGLGEKDAVSAPVEVPGRNALLGGIDALIHPSYHALNVHCERNDRLLHATLCAYAKWHLDNLDIGSDQLSEILQNAICEAIGDDAFCEWIDKMKGE